MNDLAELPDILSKPLTIGNRSIANRLVLAPMAMLGHIAYRELVSELGGCGLLFSEMCTARRVLYDNRNISPCFRWRDEELPGLVCQIVGSDPEIMAAAAERIEMEGFFGVDINFGCSAGEICRLEGGAAVMRDPALAARIVSEVRRKVSIPVFVKFRTGWKDDPGYAEDLARIFESAGADALTFHPRVAPDRRTQPPKWSYIERIKKAVSIPVFGNGNVFQPGDCLKMLQTTGCDGVAVGRMAIARPWLFSQWTGRAHGNIDDYQGVALRMAQLLDKHFEAPNALRRFRKFSIYYSANFRFGHLFHSNIMKARNMRDVEAAVLHFFQSDPDLLSCCSGNYFSSAFC